MYDFGKSVRFLLEKFLWSLPNKNIPFPMIFDHEKWNYLKRNTYRS